MQMVKTFGDTIRGMRQARGIGLRSAAERIGISPAYLSRVERDKERPPSPDVVKRLATLLGGDADILFRLAESTDPDLAEYLRDVPAAARFLRTAKAAGYGRTDFETLIRDAESRSLPE